MFSAPNRADSNFDAPKPGVDSNKDGKEDRLVYSGSDGFAAPAGWNDKNGNGLRDRFEVDQKAAQDDVIDYVLDPIRRDTDGEGITDATEIIGFKITPITGETPYWVKTNPNNPDTDSDTFTDGFERFVGLNPTNGNDKDTDGDGLPDQVEEHGWTVTTYGVSTEAYKDGGFWWPVARTYTFLDSLLFDPAPRFATGTAVRASVTGGGLTAGTDYYTGPVYSVDTKEFYRLYDSEANAREGTVDGTDEGLIDITGDIKAIVSGLQSTRMSRTDSVDTDKDGLTDYEEFFLHTDPSSKDTDHDGIDDRTEYLGYALGHKVGTEDIGIIRTDPLDADTDNDMRSDGDEAELKDVELKRWVVRVTGSVASGQPSSVSAYQVYSNPLVADADYDGLVNGEEYAVGTDPNNANTDGDRRDDGVEVHGGLNPLVEDFRVTVVAEWIKTWNDGDGDTVNKGGRGGDYEIDLQVRRPDETGVAGHR